MIQVMGETEGLEGIKFAKFLKRATGSKRMSTALLKTGAAAALIGGTAYYTNKKYNWWDKARQRLSNQKPLIKTTTTTTKTTGTVNTNLIRDIIDRFLPAAAVASTPETQPSAQQAALIPQEKSQINLPLLLGIGALLIGGYMLVKKR
ncbi:hypothetical protein [Persephonella sp.]